MEGKLNQHFKVFAAVYLLGRAKEVIRDSGVCNVFYLEAPPQGLDLNFIRAERSTFRWAGNEQVRIISEGSRVHLLRKAGHWVHSDNPSGLADIMIPEFQRCHNDRVLASMDFAN